MPAKYFVAKPAAVHVTRDGREICSEHAAGKREYFYRTREMSIRQKHLCAICGKFMLDPTFDHEAGRGFGGGFRDDSLLHKDGRWRNAAVHWLCNGRKGSRRYHWLNGKYVPAVTKEMNDGSNGLPVQDGNMAGERSLL